jgi:hypothetical protein
MSNKNMKMLPCLDSGPWTHEEAHREQWLHESVKAIIWLNSKLVEMITTWNPN